MSYRLWLEDDEGNRTQILGNNDCPQKLIEWIKDNGGKVNDDDCFHDFEIPNLQEFLEKIIDFLKDLPFDIYDLRFSKESNEDSKWDIFTMIDRYYNNYLAEIPNIITTFRHIIIREYSIENSFVYKLKEGRKLYLSGY